MPLYSYSCDNCGHTADKIRNLEDRDSPIECSVCKEAERESKMIRVTALPANPQFKGTGFTSKFH